MKKNKKEEAIVKDLNNIKNTCMLMTNSGFVIKITDIHDKTIRYRAFYLYIKQVLINGGADYLEPIFQSKVFFNDTYQILSDLLSDKFFSNSQYGEILKNIIPKFVFMHRKSNDSEELCEKINELVRKCNNLKNAKNQTEGHAIFLYYEMVLRGLNPKNQKTINFINENYGLIASWDYLFYVKNYVGEEDIELIGKPRLNRKFDIMSANKIRNEYLPIDVTRNLTRVLTNKVE